ncbi:hypothetical protein DPM19_05700 [Actinomadura craniellae]|uniref:Uncharacterized protein n=1 Tax=Actinomadura craniellae TaxID=2231787 RepID=A0A365HBH9_9ACTN|nr:hypothetical protein [Actinomadura craniellae]RAY16372.1 hypothetical protein DPM19_05700 [Actinomadura craniellae]
MKVRIIGTAEELPTALAALGRTFTVLETSRPYPRRGDSQLCSVYLEVRLTPDRPEDLSGGATP